MEFALFALTLAGVAIFHHRTLEVALGGLAAITLYKLASSGFHEGPGLAGLGAHFAAEWVIFANLFALFISDHAPLPLPGAKGRSASLG